MAREVSIDIDSVAGTVTITDVLNGSVRYSKVCGLGEYTIDQSMADLTDPSAMVAPIHISGESGGLFLLGDLTFFEINGVDQLPLADLSALIPLVGPFFFSVTGEFTLAGLLEKQTAGTLPAGQWVKVSDICDRGGWLFCSSVTTVDESGFGLFLNAFYNTQTSGNYSDIEEFTGVACSGFSGLWSEDSESVYIEFSPLVGTFTNSETIQNQSNTWFGIITEVGADYVMAYRILGSMPLIPTDIIGNGSGATATVTFVGDVPVGSVFTWLDVSSPSLGYRHYQRVGVSALNGTNPATNTTDYTVLPRSSQNYGYILNSCPISIDLANNWVYRRQQGTVDITSIRNQHETVKSFPWGCPIISQFVCSGNWIVYNTQATEIKGWNIGVGATVEAVIGSALTVNNVTVANGVSFTGKTIAASFSNMYVTADDVDTETLTYATWTPQGQRYKEVDLTSTQLLNNLDWGGGANPIVILPSVTGGYYSYLKVAHELDFNSIAYTEASTPMIASHTVGAASAAPLIIFPDTALTSSNDAVMVGFMSTSGASTVCIPEQQVIYMLASEGNQLTGDSPAKLKIWYQTETFG